MSRSTVHYANSETNNILKQLHNKLRPAGTPVERVEYIIELLLLRIFEVKLKQEEIFKPLRVLFKDENYRLLFSHLLSLNGEQILSELNKNIFPFYASILSKSRKVVEGNLPQKMQDQLVLMEEVFANSNFTNNVKGGVIAEVIGLVNEIEEKYILKTDLLGDAIESALSETGGTKDLGLYRTPDHIREIMVKMTDPDFEDTIFDPACGTAGFLFDAYDYVIEKARQTRKFPPEYIANMFYRTGISGIEYQGRIRKMAAVNMYIRGLNPHNIEQGDSLKMFDPATDSNSKSIVIANPPFGAKRDQAAYTNVWEEYSKESETTILFVKLMFDFLKDKGRCAVVVSEGFLTWGQNSAKALRKILLNEANLKAVISLPQGVFVSKSGQGAKTSILYFEKGEPTDFVWYYKIENDGFSMGTNRKQIEGSQIPEMLELFAKVKTGEKPKDTKHSFCVSKEQIETLDPRIAERITKEVKEKITEKNKKKREKLVETLNKKLADKKISQEMYDEKLWQFDNLVKSQVENEITKAIEKAHTYHFNLQNYRSNLSDEQKKEWREVLKNIEIKNGSKIEKRYKELQKAEPKTALQILASFNPDDALQMDIAREFLNKLDEKVLKENEKLRKLEEILKETKQFPMVKLGEVLKQYKNKITVKDEERYKQITISKTGEIKLREQKFGSEIGTKNQNLIDLSNGDLLIYSRLGLHTGAIGLIPNNLDKSIVTFDMPVFEFKNSDVNSRYIALITQSQNFIDSVIIQNPTGAAQTRFHEDKFLELQIPLPPLEIQNEIVVKIEKQKQIIEGAEKIEENWGLKSDLFKIKDCKIKKLGEICNLVRGPFGGSLKKEIFVSEGYAIYEQQHAIYSNFSKFRYFIDELKYKEMNRFQIRSGDLIMSCSGTMGKVAIIPNNYKKGVINQALLKITPKNKINAIFLRYFMTSDLFQDQLLKNACGVAIQNIASMKVIKDIKIPLPPLKTQREIVEKLDKQMQALEGVRLLKKQAQKRIKEILTKVWGE